MTELITRILNFFRELTLFFTIMPWERALRVRLGSRVKVLEPGWHFRFPFIDQVLPLNTRLRIADTGSQTVSTKDGASLTLGISVGFRIVNPQEALMRMQNPEQSCAALAGSVVASAVSESDRSGLTVQLIEQRVAYALRRETAYEIDFVRMRDFAYARTFRLLNETAFRGASSVHIEERKI